VSYLRNDDKTYYLACPEESCKKKVIEESVGWRCENCDKTYGNCVPTYMLSAKIADLSDTIFVNFYRHEGTALMGM
jgi:replication factor A1